MSDPPQARGRFGFAADNPWLPYVALALAMTFLGGSVVVGRAIRADIPPMGLVFWRNFIALVVILPFVYRPLRAQLPILMRHWKLLILLGLTNSISGQALLLVALHSSSAVTAGLINATVPAITVIVSWVLLRETIVRRQGFGFVVALVGVAVIVVRGDLATLLSLEFVLGDLWVQVAAASYATNNVLVKRAPSELNPFVLFAGSTFAGLVLIIPFYAGEILMSDARVAFNAITVATVLYYAIFSSVLALSFLIYGITRIGPNRASAFSYIVPVLTVVMAIALLGETFALFHALGIVLVLGGVYLASALRDAKLQSSS
ncbi:MAG: DMT family transporter [Proteobacteria bacterium]|nr:DMT family transporter [Pseudomonadota bacterium]